MFLEMLRVAVDARPEMSCRLVRRRGTPMLSIMRPGWAQPIEAGCDYVRSEWRFVRTSDGRTIGSVRDVAGTVRALAGPTAVGAPPATVRFHGAFS